MTRSGRLRKVVSLAIVLFVCGAVSADVRLPSVIGDNMVLQQGMEVTIWGWADPCEHIVIKFGYSSVAWSAVADSKGQWQTKIGPLKAGGPYEMSIEGNNKITLKNILVGEVWVCSGQSNMEWPVRQSVNGEQEVSEANYPQIRLFTVGKRVTYTPLNHCRGKWEECNPRTAAGFSAAGYFFGRELYKKLNVPVGLIHSSWGGTPAEAWMSRECLESDAEFGPILQRYDKVVANFPQLMRDYEVKMKRAAEEAAKLKAEGKPVPRRPDIERPVGPGNQNSPTGLYNAMVCPLVSYGIRGVIWYQGESNAERAWQYRKLFPALIKCWRNAWGEGDFPFLFVQLANWRKVKLEPSNSDWAELREAQLMTLSVPNTGMAVAIDIGEAESIHPTNKQEVGKRLALWALAKTYGKDVVYSGPLYQFMEVQDNKAILHFDHTGGGLVAKGGEPLKGFAVAGEDKKFFRADAKIEGDTVVVSCDKVTEPVAVRYAWADNPVCNLYNKEGEGLPASPFRTDDWPGVTRKKK